MVRVLVTVALSLGLTAAGCQKDSPEQDPPPGIFTTTIGTQAPTTTTAPGGTPARY